MLRPGSERLQELDQILLLRAGELEGQALVVVLHDVRERGGRTVVEVRRMLPEAAQRGRPIASRGAAGGVGGIHAGLLGGVERRGVGVLTVSYTHLRAHETPEHLVCR